MKSLFTVELIALRRSPANLLSVFFFALLMSIICYFSFPMETATLGRWVPYLTWLIVLLGGILQCNRSFDAEREQRVLEGLRLFPHILPQIYLSKLIVNIASMVLLLCAVSALMILFFNYPVSSIAAAYLLPSFLGIIGLAAIGTLVAAMVRSHHKRDLLLPVLAFPLLLPLALCVVSWYSALENGDGLWQTPWGHLLLAFDIIFTAAAWLLFPTLLEE